MDASVKGNATPSKDVDKSKVEAQNPAPSVDAAQKVEASAVAERQDLVEATEGEETVKSEEAVAARQDLSKSFESLSFGKGRSSFELTDGTDLKVLEDTGILKDGKINTPDGKEYDIYTEEGRKGLVAAGLLTIFELSDQGKEEGEEGEDSDNKPPKDDEIYDSLPEDGKEVYAYAKDIMEKNDLEGPIMNFVLAMIALTSKVKGFSEAFIPGKFMESVKEEQKDEKLSKADIDAMVARAKGVTELEKQKFDGSIEKASTEYVASYLGISETINSPKSLAGKLMNTTLLGIDNKVHKAYDTYESTTGYSKLIEATDVPIGTVVLFTHAESKMVVPAVATGHNKEFSFYHPDEGIVKKSLRKNSSEPLIGSGLTFHAAFVPKVSQLDPGYFGERTSFFTANDKLNDYKAVEDKTEVAPEEGAKPDAVEAIDEAKKTPEENLRAATKAGGEALAALEAAKAAVMESEAADTEKEAALTKAKETAKKSQVELEDSIKSAEIDRPVAGSESLASLKTAEIAAKETNDKLKTALEADSKSKPTDQGATAAAAAKAATVPPEAPKQKTD